MRCHFRLLVKPPLAPPWGEDLGWREVYMVYKVFKVFKVFKVVGCGFLVAGCYLICTFFEDVPCRRM